MENYWKRLQEKYIYSMAQKTITSWLQEKNRKIKFSKTGIVAGRIYKKCP